MTDHFDEVLVESSPTGAGRAPVAVASLQTDAPICPWCDRQGWDTCQHADDARTCGK